MVDQRCCMLSLLKLMFLMLKAPPSRWVSQTWHSYPTWEPDSHGRASPNDPEVVPVHRPFRAGLLERGLKG